MVGEKSSLHRFLQYSIYHLLLTNTKQEDKRIVKCPKTVWPVLQD